MSARLGSQELGRRRRGARTQRLHIGEVDDKTFFDAAIIAAGQAVEHYEITRYGSLIAWAKRLGRNDVAKVLEQTPE